MLEVHFDDDPLRITNRMLKKVNAVSFQSKRQSQTSSHLGSPERKKFRWKDKLLLITRLIVIYIALLTVLFCNYPLFCNCPLADVNCPLLKDISFSTKCLLVWCN